MKTNFDKKNPKKVLGYLMASALVFFTGSVSATNHDVVIDSGNNSFSPASLTIDVGDSVTWTNDGGFHNVNGDLATYPSNADGSIYSGAASTSLTTYVWVCTTAGNYDYQCDPHAGQGMIGSIAANAPPTVLLITTTVCSSALEVRLTGPWWGWDPAGGPIAVDNGNGTFTFTFSPAPTANMEYLLVVDGVQENLLNAPHPDIDGDGYGDLWGCSPITDYWSYANRNWTAGSGDVNNTYATCGSCSDVYGCMDPNADNVDPAANVMDYSVCTYAVPGCTDATADNYNSAATTDDGSCTYPVVCALDELTVTLYDAYLDGGGSITVDGNVLTNSGASSSMVVCVDLSGCVDVTYTATDSWPFENSWDVTDASGAIIASGDDASGNVGSGCAVYGCTDPAANNYDPAANTDDGSCITCSDNFVSVVYSGGTWASEVSWDIVNSSGTSVLTGDATTNTTACLPNDCYTVLMYDAFGDGWGNSLQMVLVL